MAEGLDPSSVGVDPGESWRSGTAFIHLINQRLPSAPREPGCYGPATHQVENKTDEAPALELTF